MEPICLREARKEVDASYVGFAPNGSSIKPVHVAGGSLRCIYGSYNRTMSIKRLALVSDKRGNVPVGNDTETIYRKMIDDEKIEDNISESEMDSMRNVMHKLIDSDKGVYVVSGLRDGMISYSAGSKYFLTVKAMYEDAGEFVGGLVRSYCPQLAEHIKQLLDDGNDPITLLFEPVLEEDMEVFANRSLHEDIPAFINQNKQMEVFINSIKISGECLLDNLKKHPNPLTQIRLFNFFCIFTLIRYMTMLEAFYCGESIRPVLLDFSEKSPSFSSVARMSEMAYTQIYKSVNRFYSWGYAKWLDAKGYSKEDLLASPTPVYERGKDLKGTTKDELDILWNLAKENAKVATDEDCFLVFGEAMYNMLALEASSHPVNYIRALGTLSGILYPPDKLHPNKRFVVSQDVLEMILRSCVNSDEVISGAEIRTRMWERFGIIIGGSPFEMKVLQSSGMIIQIDVDALEDNFSSFSKLLESMDFAEVMADGILQIRMGGIYND